MRRALSRTACTAGNNKPTRRPMMAMTTISSTSVKADRTIPSFCRQYFRCSQWKSDWQQFMTPSHHTTAIPKNHERCKKESLSIGNELPQQALHVALMTTQLSTRTLSKKVTSRPVSGRSSDFRCGHCIAFSWDRWPLVNRDKQTQQWLKDNAVTDGIPRHIGYSGRTVPDFHRSSLFT